MKVSQEGRVEVIFVINYKKCFILIFIDFEYK